MIVSCTHENVKQMEVGCGRHEGSGEGTGEWGRDNQGGQPQADGYNQVSKFDCSLSELLQSSTVDSQLSASDL